MYDTDLDNSRGSQMLTAELHPATQDNNPDWFNQAMQNLQNSNNHTNTPPPQSRADNRSTPAPVQSSGSPAKQPARRRFAANDEERFTSIDHNARAEQLKQQNYLKFRAKYGDEDMRGILGGRQTEGGNNQGQVSSGQGNQYKPSWTDNGHQHM